MDQLPGSPREQVLEAAARLFTGRGYAATSTREIAEAVGVRQASLYATSSLRLCGVDAARIEVAAKTADTLLDQFDGILPD